MWNFIPNIMDKKTLFPLEFAQSYFSRHAFFILFGMHFEMGSQVSRVVDKMQFLEVNFRLCNDLVQQFERGRKKDSNSLAFIL